MKKTLVTACLFAVGLAACGGGGGSSGSDSAQPVAKSLNISMYGKPIVSTSSTAVAHAQFSLISAAVAADAPNAASDAQTTVKSLTDALAERGVTANVTTQVMDGTALHQIVTTEYNGKSPTPDQFKTDPGEWLIVNFQLDDMVTPSTDSAQQAAMTQFAADLLVFSQWAAVAGKAVFVVAPTLTCDTQYSAASGLRWALDEAFRNGAPIRFIGSVPTGFGFDSSGKPVPNVGTDLSHYGADCRSPDSYLQNALLDSIADEVAAAYKQSADTSAASAVTAGSTPAASQ
ncbi:hypothetical protein F4827_005089 [Paraburkholderia bannensis]|uniref:SGNH/GDSL hydrolase family protein n=1 Tax=Paraburkholderia bannensis TaxID=765414 RepID=A0A7W9WVT6_9BURK|nr:MULTISPECIES: hypothetical protein [Paraburkholderia]MBB3260017.1 hypothetical protein [Paraburkholderia sp. WP4_3_2]MBB6105223.1 hypothetical protein [Paraburkholderia bannensis]